MKIYDISQELLSCEVYEGDPRPCAVKLSGIDEGAPYNLSAFSMCAHNGTHIDAPYHFIPTGDAVDKIELKKLIGYAYVCRHEGDFTSDDATRVLKIAEKSGLGAEKRILIAGNSAVTLEAARTFSESGIFLLGSESQTVGPKDAPMAVHKALLSHGAVLLEGVRLSEIDEGVYLLSAPPLNIAGFDGAPCRAVLIDLE